MTNAQPETNYRWYVLILAALTHTLTVAVQVMCLPVLFKEISAELSLNLVQIGLIWAVLAAVGMMGLTLIKEGGAPVAAKS